MPKCETISPFQWYKSLQLRVMGDMGLEWCLSIPHDYDDEACVQHDFQAYIFPENTIEKQPSYSAQQALCLKLPRKKWNHEITKQ